MRGERTLSLVSNWRIFIDQLKANDEAAWELWMYSLANYKHHCLYMLYGVYGMTEMQCRNIQDDCDAAMNCAAVEAIRKFTYDPDENEKSNFLRLVNYTHIHMKNSMRRVIEEANGVTKYMAGYLLRIKKWHLDLWESSDEDLYACILSVSPYCKNLEKMLQKIRAFFYDRESGDTCFESLINAEEKCNPLKEVEYKISMESLRKEVGDIPYNLFRDYYLADEKITMNALAIRYQMPVTDIRGSLKKTAEKARGIFAEIPVKKDVLNAIDDKQRYSAATVVEVESLDELLELVG